MVLASKVHLSPLKFLSKEGQNSQRDQRLGNVGSKNEPTLPDRWFLCTF